jgi:hypothetical protein
LPFRQDLCKAVGLEATARPSHILPFRQNSCKAVGFEATARPSHILLRQNLCKAVGFVVAVVASSSLSSLSSLSSSSSWSWSRRRRNANQAKVAGPPDGVATPGLRRGPDFSDTGSERVAGPLDGVALARLFQHEFRRSCKSAGWHRTGRPSPKRGQKELQVLWTAEIGIETAGQRSSSKTRVVVVVVAVAWSSRRRCRRCLRRRGRGQGAVATQLKQTWQVRWMASHRPDCAEGRTSPTRSEGVASPLDGVLRPWPELPASSAIVVVSPPSLTRLSARG